MTIILMAALSRPRNTTGNNIDSPMATVLNEAELSLGAVINRTGNTGTPALPMDIRYVDSEQYSIDPGYAGRARRLVFALQYAVGGSRDG